MQTRLPCWENLTQELFVKNFVMLVALVWLTTSSWAQEEREAKPEKSASKLPPALKEYKGRRIAQTMHYLGAEWLTRDNREQEERCSLMLANLGLKRGMSVCDMGCGNGFHTVQL